jgi:uncharacterized protein
VDAPFMAYPLTPLHLDMHSMICFGIGMSLAGGCGIGILWRSAEGYTRAWVAVITGALTAGAWVMLYGKHVGEGWLYGKPHSLAEYGGWFGGAAIVFAFLAAFYLFILYVESGKRERA